MTLANRQLRLQSRPKGLVALGDLQLSESPVPELKDGQALARVKYLSIDPTMRVWMAVDSYLPAVAIGEVMRAGGFAEIVESRHPGYKKGDRVTGLTGLQEYVVIDAVREELLPKVAQDSFRFGYRLPWRARLQRTHCFFRHGDSRAQERRNARRLRRRRRHWQHRRTNWKDSRLPRRWHCWHG